VFGEGGLGQGVAGRILRSRGIDPFGISAGDLDEGVILHPVIGEEIDLQSFLFHHADNLRRLRMIAAEYDGLGPGLLDFLDDGRVVDRPRVTPSNKTTSALPDFSTNDLANSAKPLP